MLNGLIINLFCDSKMCSNEIFRESLSMISLRLLEGDLVIFPVVKSKLSVYRASLVPVSDTWRVSGSIAW